MSHSSFDHPWFLAYFAGTVIAAVVALGRGRLPGLALAATSAVAMLAAGWSVLLVYGPLFPYLVIWAGALVVPTWVTAWLVLAPLPADQAEPSAQHALPSSGKGLVVPLASLAAVTAISIAFAVGPYP